MLYTFSSSPNYAPNKFSVLKYNHKLNKNSIIITNRDSRYEIDNQLIILMLTSIC